MKKSTIAVFIGFCLISLGVSAQKIPALDKSPADIAYHREDNKPVVKVVYSRPAKRERVIFGELVPFGKVWRTGANEATEVKFFKDVTFGGKKVKAGTYSLFTIPEKEEWTIILNSDTDVWGAYSYNEKNDVVRFKVKTAKTDQTVEYFTITFAEENMVLAWDNTKVEISIED